MLKPFISAAITLCAVPALAEPMWDIADRWSCSLDFHMKVNHDGTHPRANEEQGEVTYDFAKGTRTSIFVSTVAKIGERHYYEGLFGNFNLIELLWDGDPYPVTVIEKDGAFWSAAVSGLSNPDGEVWIAAYHCVPEANS